MHARSCSSLVVAIVALTLGSISAGRADLGDDCSISAPCCSASAGTAADPCDLQYDTCTCMYVCGPKKQSCSCTCEKGSRPTIADPPKKVDPQTNAGVTMSGVAPTLAALASWLQPVLNWWIQVDATKAANIVPTGSYTGTVEQVLNQIAANSGTTVTINEGTSTISFH